MGSRQGDAMCLHIGAKAINTIVLADMKKAARFGGLLQVSGRGMVQKPVPPRISLMRVPTMMRRSSSSEKFEM
jgi:hypothetical protein